MIPVVWTIAGSDSSGGAGIQADLKTFQSLGVHGASVIAAVTAQSGLDVTAFETVSPALLDAQMEALSRGLPPKAIKIGMLGDETTAAHVAAFLKKVDAPIVCDPVLSSSSGTTLLSGAGIDILTREIFPRAICVTPNIPEAELLSGKSIKGHESAQVVAEWFLKQGASSVLLKGGHGESALAQDYFTDGKNKVWLSLPRQSGAKASGTGCTLSSAIAAGLAGGLELLDSIVLAKGYVTRGLRMRRRAGVSEVLHHAPWPGEAADLPWITTEAEFSRPQFAFCRPRRIGFYPIVDRADWVERLLGLGAQSIQLRIKDLRGGDLESELARAIAAARKAGAQLFVNDHWQLAIKLGAYGVHLGQEDLAAADLSAIERAGLRLGVSTHSYSEVARAHAVRPSYIAIGPIFPTTTKEMKFAPQGAKGLALWRQLLDYPLVAIGGITLEHAPELSAAGADGLAVVRDVMAAKDPDARIAAWMAQKSER